MIYPIRAAIYSHDFIFREPLALNENEFYSLRDYILGNPKRSICPDTFKPFIRGIKLMLYVNLAILIADALIFLFFQISDCSSDWAMVVFVSFLLGTLFNLIGLAKTFWNYAIYRRTVERYYDELRENISTHNTYAEYLTFYNRRFYPS